MIIPQNYSRRAFFSIPFLLMTFFSARMKRYDRITNVLPFLLLTSILHWNKVKEKGIIRKLDIIMVFITILTIESYSKRFRTFDKWLWRFSLCCSSIAYIINKTITKDPLQMVYIHMIFIHAFSGIFSSIAIYNSKSF
jgi:hypothetical protein